jgi:hypothetical protein
MCVAAAPSIVPRNITEPLDGSDSDATATDLKLDPYCLPERSMGNRNEAMSCLNFLFSRNEQWCELTSQRSAEFCFSGKTRITGVTETRKPERAKCAEVAHAIAWVIDNCANGTKVGGKFNLTTIIFVGTDDCRSTIDDWKRESQGCGRGTIAQSILAQRLESNISNLIQSTLQRISL